MHGEVAAPRRPIATGVTPQARKLIAFRNRTLG
jgi:hypothetical protein